MLNDLQKYKSFQSPFCMGDSLYLFSNHLGAGLFGETSQVLKELRNEIDPVIQRSQEQSHSSILSIQQV